MTHSTSGELRFFHEQVQSDHRVLCGEGERERQKEREGERERARERACVWGSRENGSRLASTQHMFLHLTLLFSTLGSFMRPSQLLADGTMVACVREGMRLSAIVWRETAGSFEALGQRSDRALSDRPR